MGKLGVPDRILLKPGKLTAEEWLAIKQHPQYAYDSLSTITYLRPALDIPYCHHEKWDCTGYPRGLKGEQISFITAAPLSNQARYPPSAIVAVVTEPLRAAPSRPLVSATSSSAVTPWASTLSQPSPINRPSKPTSASDLRPATCRVPPASWQGQHVLPIYLLHHS